MRQGEFTFWVNAEFNWTLRTAQRYMSAAKFLAGKATCMSLLPAHLIYRISAPSADPEIVQDVVEAAEAGTPLAPKEIEGRLDATVLRRRREPQRDTAQVRQSSVLTQDPVETESPLGAAHDAADPIEDQPLISAAAAPAPVSVPAPTTMSILQVQLEHARQSSLVPLAERVIAAIGDDLLRQVREALDHPDDRWDLIRLLRYGLAPDGGDR